ncbi:neuropilin-1a-like [Diadema antillarum]|uniref:neuropilin-1a-like n=1 Tax=Diadema antillarum TaxID=105358 RepID=UPI003A85E1EB
MTIYRHRCNDLRINWVIRAPVAGEIVLKFIAFDLEPGYDFLKVGFGNRKDILYIGDGKDVGNRATILATFTGSLQTTQRTSVESKSNWIWVMFVSDYADTREGFQIEISSITPDIDLVNDLVTTIETPTWLVNSSHEVRELYWTCTAPEDNVIKIQFLRFDIPNDIEYVSIASLVATWDGRMTSYPEVITSTNGLWVNLVSGRANKGRGFQIQMSTFTPPIVLDADQTYQLTSPSFPMSYENNAHITWRIMAPYGFGILLHFVMFDLDDEGDQLVIGQGNQPDATDSILQRFTGRGVPSDFAVWARKRAWMRFTSDSTGYGSGFDLEIRSVIGGGYCLIPLGVERGWIPDVSLTATSQKDGAHSPSHARLHGRSSWMPKATSIHTETIKVR